MNDKEYQNSLIFRNLGEVLEPVNLKAKQFLQDIKIGKEITLKEVTKRDLKFHRAYFEFIHQVYSYLPQTFKSRIPKDKFYIFLKELQGRYVIIYRFKNGSELKEYDSIAFDKMTQVEFETFVREQLPFIYENLIYALFDKKRADSVIATIEEDFKIFLSKL